MILALMMLRTYCFAYNQYVAQREFKAALQSMQETINQLQSE